MKNRVFSLLLVLCMVLALLPLAAGAAETVKSGSLGEHVTWTLDADGLLTVSGTGDMNNYKYSFGSVDDTPLYSNKSIIRSIVIQPGVTSIGDAAFHHCSNLTTVTIPDSVTRIGNHAFDLCTGLTDVTIPNSVTSIGDSAFSHCEALKNATIPQSVTSIGTEAFAACESLTSVTIPEKLTSIADGAFAGCAGLTSVTIPESVTSIGNDAFNGCEGLTSVTIPENVTRIGIAVFRSCKGLKSVKLPSGLEDISNMAFYDCTALTDIDIPEGVMRINRMAFSGCTGLTSVTIPSSMVSIGNYAFADCTGLTSVTLRSTMAGIHDQAFDGCTALKDVYFDGTQKEWDSLYIFDGNDPLINANIHVNPSPAIAFDDVPKGAYFAEPVAWAVQQNITQGTGAGTFSPDMTCTRGQVVTFLWRAAGEPEPTSTENPFTDVAPSDYYCKAVLWAVEKNITQGTGNGLFSPDGACTRGQVVTFLHRANGTPAAQKSENPFQDVASGAYYYDAVLWAVENGITSGTGAGAFSPDMTCSRGQIVTFLYRDRT